MDREHLILREIVETYIDSGEAVGSKTVSERLQNTLSSASIRAVMAALGNRGLIAQPHTSSGRVPTDRGWREYLDAILVPEGPKPRDRARIERLSFRDGRSPQKIMREAASMAASELGVAAVVVAPRLENSVLKRMELVPLGRGRLLALAVTEGGFVHERLLIVEDSLARAEIERFSNYLNSVLPGLTLAEVRLMLEAAQQEDRDALEKRAAEIGQRALEGDIAELDIFVEGASRILAQREFTESPQFSGELLQALEERASWLALLEKVEATDDARVSRVFVGEEVPGPGFSQCGLVVTRWSTGHAAGIVAVFGPKRLDYRRAIPLVSLVGQRLGEVLVGRSAG